MVPALNALSRVVRVVFVYISEAHASDEWPISQPFESAQSRTVDERRVAAQEMIRLGLDVDTFVADDVFEQTYRPWPLRVFVIRLGRIVYAPEPIAGTYDIVGVWNFCLEADVGNACATPGEQ